MARLVTKFKYLKPNRKQKAGGYAKYIATREGAEKIDESFRYSFVSGKQCKLIEKLLKDFPDTKEMHEYKDYLANPSAGNASRAGRSGTASTEQRVGRRAEKS